MRFWLRPSHLSLPPRGRSNRNLRPLGAYIPAGTRHGLRAFGLYNDVRPANSTPLTWYFKTTLTFEPETPALTMQLRPIGQLLLQHYYLDGTQDNTIVSGTSWAHPGACVHVPRVRVLTALTRSLVHAGRSDWSGLVLHLARHLLVRRHHGPRYAIHARPHTRPAISWHLFYSCECPTVPTAPLPGPACSCADDALVIRTNARPP